MGVGRQYHYRSLCSEGGRHCGGSGGGSAADAGVWVCRWSVGCVPSQAKEKKENERRFSLQTYMADKSLFSQCFQNRIPLYLLIRHCVFSYTAFTFEYKYNVYIICAGLSSHGKFRPTVTNPIYETGEDVYEELPDQEDNKASKLTSDQLYSEVPPALPPARYDHLPTADRLPRSKTASSRLSTSPSLSQQVPSPLARGRTATQP